ncbi:MAG: hypothetical protein COW71_09115 [Ignavibacteriales bacterium CG18_big_fil_WC_8_21_14_2_50_31_20]|nr:MAG: hypothetical protein COW71_09115 [Ignavibacteriales bacterium CG18_big_fil_WC_8_21_14_2_50_31_20]
MSSSCTLNSNWWRAIRKPRSNFLFPVKALSKIFKAKFRDLLEKENPTLFNSIPIKVWNKAWVVNSIPVGRGEKALKYLAQYVFRIAISNSRIISLKNGFVVFKYKESKTDEWKIMNIKAEEFIRRFLQHVLPSGFVKVRYYGLFASANRKQLARAREILGCKELKSKKQLKPNKPFKCPQCKKEMILVSVMLRYAVLNNKAPPIIKLSTINTYHLRGVE